jgi:hypothetical protein
MRYIRKFYDFLTDWSQAIYEYRQSRYSKYYY